MHASLGWSRHSSCGCRAARCTHTREGAWASAETGAIRTRGKAQKEGASGPGSDGGMRGRGRGSKSGWWARQMSKSTLSLPDPSALAPAAPLPLLQRGQQVVGADLRSLGAAMARGDAVGAGHGGVPVHATQVAWLGRAVCRQGQGGRNKKQLAGELNVGVWAVEWAVFVRSVHSTAQAD